MTGGLAVVRANFTVSGDDFDFLPRLLLADDSRQCTRPRSGRLDDSLAILQECMSGLQSQSKILHTGSVSRVLAAGSPDSSQQTPRPPQALNRERNCRVQLTRSESRLTFQLAVKPLFPAREFRLAAGCFCCTESGSALSLVW